MNQQLRIRNPLLEKKKAKLNLCVKSMTRTDDQCPFQFYNMNLPNYFSLDRCKIQLLILSGFFKSPRLFTFGLLMTSKNIAFHICIIINTFFIFCFYIYLFASILFQQSIFNLFLSSSTIIGKALLLGHT